MSISLGEILVIALVALFVIGPQRLPSVMRVISKKLTRVFHIYRQLKKEILDDIQYHDGK